MTTNFPGSVDSFPRPTSTTNTDDPGFELDVVIDNLSDALEAVETTLGFQPLNAQTGTTYTLAASDAGKLVTLTNAGAITLSVPGSTFTAGQRVDCVVLGTGMVTVTAGTGAPTVNGTPSLVSRARYSAFSVIALSASSFVVVGDLA